MQHQGRKCNIKVENATSRWKMSSSIKNMKSGRFSDSEISVINITKTEDNYGIIYSSWANSFDNPE